MKNLSIIFKICDHKCSIETADHIIFVIAEPDHLFKSGHAIEGGHQTLTGHHFKRVRRCIKSDHHHFFTQRAKRLSFAKKLSFRIDGDMYILKRIIEVKIDHRLKAELFNLYTDHHTVR